MADHVFLRADEVQGPFDARLGRFYCFFLLLDDRENRAYSSSKRL